MNATAEILRPVVSILNLAVTDGTETIPNAYYAFTGYIDLNFRDWDVDETSDPTPEIPVTVYELASNATFGEMFSSLSDEAESLCLTQHQIIRFCEDHRSHLCRDQQATFFLFQSKGRLLVARVWSFDDAPRVRAYMLDDEYVWDAEERYRVVVPGGL